MYEALIALLEATGIPAAEGPWNNAPQSGSYLEYQLEGQGAAFWADDEMQEQAISGSVDLFCRTNSREDFHKVQQALDASGVSWQLFSIQREVKNRLVHYEWTFELERLEDT